MPCISRDLFRENLAFFMKRAKMNQSQLAKELGVSKATVSCWLSGKAFPRIDTMQEIADCLNCTVSQLTSGRKKRILSMVGRIQSNMGPLQKSSVLQTISSNSDVLQARNIMGMSDEKTITIKTESGVKRGALPDRLLEGGVFEVEIKGKCFDDIFPSRDMVASVKRDTSEIIKLLVQMPEEQRAQAVRAVKRVQKRGLVNKKLLEINGFKK